MSLSALVMMILVCSLVWGGFSVLLIRAIRKEGAKAHERLDEHPPHRSP